MTDRSVSRTPPAISCTSISQSGGPGEVRVVGQQRLGRFDALRLHDRVTDDVPGARGSSPDAVRAAAPRQRRPHVHEVVPPSAGTTPSTLPYPPSSPPGRRPWPSPRRTWACGRAPDTSSLGFLVSLRPGGSDATIGADGGRVNGRASGSARRRSSSGAGARSKPWDVHGKIAVSGPLVATSSPDRGLESAPDAAASHFRLRRRALAQRSSCLSLEESCSPGSR